MAILPSDHPTKQGFFAIFQGMAEVPDWGDETDDSCRCGTRSSFRPKLTIRSCWNPCDKQPLLVIIHFVVETGDLLPTTAH